MKSHTRSLLFATCICLSATQVIAADNDWPCWRGPARDGISPETGLLDEWPEGGPTELWRAPIGLGFSAVTVADGRAYTMYATESDEFVVCLDTTNGKELWKHRSGETFKNEYGNGPRATPTVDEGRVYTHGATGSLLCLDAVSGEKKWGFNTLQEFGAKNLDFGLSASPLILGKMLIAVVGGQDGKSLVAFDKTTGNVLWSSMSDLGGYSTPLPFELAGLKQLAVLTGKNIVCVSQTDGRELWRDEWLTNLDANVATPIVDKGRLFISSDSGAALYQLTLDGDACSGEELWMTTKMKNNFSSSVLFKGCLYGFHDRILKCIDFETGDQHWISRGFNHGSLLLADNKIFVLGERGTLAVAKASPDDYEELARAEQILEAPTWTVPTIADGKLFIRNQEELVCLKVK